MLKKTFNKIWWRRPTLNKLCFVSHICTSYTWWKEINLSLESYINLLLDNLIKNRYRYLLDLFFTIHTNIYISPKIKTDKHLILIRVRVFNITFNNISVISWQSFIGGGKRSTQKKSLTCHKSLTNFIT